jgi:leader peptidase (prepilin peptidase) / N-methyltransferase
MVWARVLLALPFALVIGSFMTVVVARIPEGGSVVGPSSRCPKCGTPIRPIDNIPVISWLVLRGKCRSCGEPISAVYPLIELSTAAVMLVAVARFDRPWVFVMLALLMSMMPALSLIDIRHRIVPNKVTYPAFVIALVYVTVAWLFHGGPNLVRGIEGCLLYAGPLFLLAFLYPRGMGLGDVKLVAVIGLVLGSVGLRYVGVAAGSAILLGGLGGIVALALGADRKSAIPFGPYLAAGSFVSVLAGSQIASGYLHLFPAGLK